MVSSDSIKHRLTKLIEHGELTKTDVTYLQSPARKQHITIHHDTTSYDAYRVLFNDDRGPGKGGIRYHPEVNEEEVTTLSFWMALKTSLADIPFGGAKGGIATNTKQLSEEAIEAITRSYTRQLRDNIGPNKDIPAPDMYTDETTMAHIVDEYETLIGEHQPGVVTGKPLCLGGSHGRSTATGRGASIILDEHVKTSQRIAVQGFGNAGYHFAKDAANNGHTVVAVSDSQGGIYDETGLDLEEIHGVKEQTGSVVNADKKTVSNDELLRLDVDVLAPAALGDVITAENADEIRADTVLEIANGPISPGAENYLDDIDVLPDILVNSGGVIVSYYEWVQNRTGETWAAQTIDNKLRDKLRTNYTAVQSRMTYSELSYRYAAYVIAAERILEAASYRGRR